MSETLDYSIEYAFQPDEEVLNQIAHPENWRLLQDEGLVVELIEDEYVAEVYEWQKNYARKNGVSATPSVLEDQFKDLELFAPKTTPADLMDRLRTQYARNVQRRKLEEIVKLQHDDPLAVGGKMIHTGRELTSLLSPKGEVFGTGDFDRARLRYEDKAARGHGPSLGHDLLDSYFYGMIGLTFWIAPPKTFKSWQMIQGLIGNVEKGRCAHLYSLELPAEETDMRLRCLLADVPWWRYVRNLLGDHEWTQIQEVSELLDGLGVYKIIKPPIGERGISDMVQRSKDQGADVIFFDQLQYIEAAEGGSLGEHNDTKKYFQVLNHARDLSDDIPICIAHQFNRDAMYCDSMPPIQNAKGSSSIEEVATLALGLFANKDMRRSNVAEVGTLIARNHMLPSWEMDIDMSSGCSFTIERVKEDEE